MYDDIRLHVARSYTSSPDSPFSLISSFTLSNHLLLGVPTDAENAAHRIGNCVTDLKRWLTDHQLLLNESKTEAIAFNVPSCKVPPAITDINICGCNITLQQTVRDIGVVMDSGLDMSAQVSRMCQSAYFQLHNIAKIRHCLTVNTCKTIVHALVTSKLDYGNAVLFGINGRLLNKLQITQNSAARLIMRQHHTCPNCITLASNSISCNVQITGADISRNPQSCASIHH